MRPESRGPAACVRGPRQGATNTPPGVMQVRSSTDHVNPAQYEPERHAMSIPYPPDYQIDYHEDLQRQRVEKALKMIEPGDVLAVIDARIAAEPDPTVHPLYGLVCWHLSKQLTPLDGGQFYDRFKQLVLAAIDTCLDEVLAMEED
jgi:hypothetical protein